MGIIILIILAIVIIAIISGSSNGHRSYQDGYVRDYDDDEDFEEYETSVARGEREYFSDDPARDYDSYYAQVADDAMMGDQDAIDEMRGEFGDGEW